MGLHRYIVFCLENCTDSNRYINILHLFFAGWMEILNQFTKPEKVLKNITVGQQILCSVMFRAPVARVKYNHLLHIKRQRVCPNVLPSPLTTARKRFM